MAEEIRRIAALLDQPLSDKDLDLISFVKHKFATEFKKETNYHPEKVVTRSDTKRVSVAAPDDQGKNNCERRRELLSTGFFSPANKPYKSVGILYNDNIDLFSSWLSPQDQKSLKSQWEKKFGKKPGVTTTSSKFNQEKAKRDESSLVGPAQAPQVGKGFLHLRQYLREMAAIQNTLRSGRPLVFCLREQDAHSVHARSSCDKVSSAEGEALKPVPLCLNEQLDPEEEAKLERAFLRKQENFSEQLKWIYKILCGISHMRNRDLKTLVPLNSVYVNIIMKDTEKTNVLLKQSHSSYSRPLGPNWRLLPIVPEDCQNITDVWETFLTQDTPEIKSAIGQSPRLRPRKKPLSEGETADMPPWFTVLEESIGSIEKKPPNSMPNEQISMLEKAKAEFLGIRRALNYQIETDVFEKKKNREERIKTLLKALMMSKTEPVLSTLLVSLKSEFREPKSTGSLWFARLRQDAFDLGGDKDSRFHDILEKIAKFQNLSTKNVPYTKEKCCLLVISLPASQLLRPALQEALLFLTNHVLQILPRQLRQWYQYLKLPFTVPMGPSNATSPAP
ncbi:hypothetical protein AALO_G00217050 [Alosa alosa]|uniref:Uncharacterized protein n=1 Tax=Alosa alosa TaxID=278164 RepID=A0AAV6G2J1_9TELE|nr:uncharacterized protein LOC125309615 isoform X1 [Alosa alosa]KAG5268839.1 hypothetical protein AALO_G00217050 [Alosa alosa]